MIDFLAIAFSLPNALLNLGKPVSFQRDRLRAVFLYVARYLPLHTRASLRRSAVNAIPAPMKMRANVALKLPGAMQLIQVPMIAGASNMAAISLLLSLDGPQTAGVNPLSFARVTPAGNRSTLHFNLL